MEEYIVAYRRTEANIRSKAVDESFFHNQMTDMYKWALSHYLDREWGDCAPWNNQLWCTVMADNAFDALNACLKKIEQCHLRKGVDGNDEQRVE